MIAALLCCVGSGRVARSKRSWPMCRRARSAWKLAFAHFRRVIRSTQNATDTDFLVYMSANDPKPSQELHLREA
jgi:hypothetical protein